GMRGAKGIEFAFRPLGKPGQSATLPKRANTVTTTRQDFVRVGLMSDIPDQLVIRGVEQVMESDRQLHDPEAGSKVATGYGNCAPRRRRQVVRQLPELLRMETT